MTNLPPTSESNINRQVLAEIGIRKALQLDPSNDDCLCVGCEEKRQLMRAFDSLVAERDGLREALERIANTKRYPISIQSIARIALAAQEEER